MTLYGSLSSLVGLVAYFITLNVIKNTFNRTGRSHQSERITSSLLPTLLFPPLLYLLLLPTFTTSTLSLASILPLLLSILSGFILLAIGTLIPNLVNRITTASAASLLVITSTSSHLQSNTLLVACGIVLGFVIPSKYEYNVLVVGTSIIGAATALAFTDGAGFVLPQLLNVTSTTHVHQFVFVDKIIDVIDPTYYADSSDSSSITPFTLWLLSSIFLFILILHRTSSLPPFLSLLTSPFSYIRLQNPPKTQPQATSITSSSSSSSSTYHRSTNPPTPTSTTSYNYLDPTFLPPHLLSHGTQIYTACEDLGNFFGFQDSSVRGQAEHLVLLVGNLCRNSSNGIEKLHSKVFENYKQWCRSLDVNTCFNTSEFGDYNEQSKTYDLTLYFCIWGEAANLRHVPECLCFLYHKLSSTYITSSLSQRSTRSLYPGHFLDFCILPIYDVISKNMSSREDHVSRKNYDDVNEFFWRKECLNYSYIDSSAIPEDEEVQYGTSAAQSQSQPPPLPSVAVGLQAAPKTFLEKRSWYRPILSLSRVLEFHIITFYLLTILALSRKLVWGWVYSLQCYSVVFIMFNFLHLVWGLLEVWGVYPNIVVDGTAVTGHLLNLISRFLILVYQSIYLLYTFSPDSHSNTSTSTSEGISPGSMNFNQDASYWWWQYIWLSCLHMVPYFVECIANIWPYGVTLLFTSENPYLQSFLNIVSPLTRLYVDKVVHESLKNSLKYTLFWVTLLSFKLVFSYYFEVSSMIAPTLNLTDDYQNYPSSTNIYYLTVLIVLRWSPQFFVYLIDTSIWYALWQGVAGTAVGFQENLGDIRTIDDVRKNFSRCSAAFCEKVVAQDSKSRLNGRRSSDVPVFYDDDDDDDGNGNGNVNVNGNDNGESRSLLNAHTKSFQSYVNEGTKKLLDVKIQKWVFFGEAWNEIIDHFREEDIISNKEMKFLKFTTFENFSMPIYLPVFQTAGVIDNVICIIENPEQQQAQSKAQQPSNLNSAQTDKEVFNHIAKSHTMKTAVSETWELGCYAISVLLGSVHDNDVMHIFDTFTKWQRNGTICSHVKVEKLRNVVDNLAGLVSTLQKDLSRRKPSTTPYSNQSDENSKAKQSKVKPRSARGIPSAMRKALSTNSLSSLQVEKPGSSIASLNLETPLNRNNTTANRKANVVIMDVLRDQVRDKIRAFAHSLKGMLMNSDAEAAGLADRLTFLLSMENGFIWNDSYASSQLDNASMNSLFKDVIEKVNGLITAHPDDVEPKSKEAKRRLTFFVNSLFMEVPTSPNMSDMMSFNIMTPFYSEDVTYTKADLEAKSSALGVSVLLYLQTLYKNDWSNFLERNRIEDEEKVWSKKYLPETRRWASLRAQTLSRTVSGMMMNEKALRLLAKLEGHSLEATNDLMCEKFGYVVACQVYGTMKKNQDSKADDIDDLMHRFPHMRVAYIDNLRINRDGDSVFFSVLVKSDGEGGIQEIYRVRLPGNPVVGEGKPENQNHAIIFTRGECLQTIDMNQEGYFEESLKMRNLLQEFSKSEMALPTTIVGFREHIFTGSVSSLANYMALQETSFVTLGQRVLAKPLCLRFHYGHPDVFDKLFFMTRGGISKSSRGINLSEDIFAGYNNCQRGGSVAFKEYIQVGKGRDVGGQQIYKFEAKLSQGNAEQSLSRDVYRIAMRLDFFRMMSMYFGGIGHYFGNVLTVFTVYLVCYLMLGLALFDCETIGDRKITPSGTLQMLLGGMGLLQTLPLFATLGVERGWWASFCEICQVFVTGGPLHFMFHIQTKAHYFAQTILVGGAKYRATGRGFVTQHSPFDENFRFFASSHLYLGFELSAALILMGVYSQAGQYFGRTWSLWLASISFLAAPFWFNPLTFEWGVVNTDYNNWLKWTNGTSGGPLKSWDIWWVEENSFYKGMPLSSKLVFILKAALYAVVANGIRASDLLAADDVMDKPWISVATVFTVVVGLMVASKLFSIVINGGQQGHGMMMRRTFSIFTTVALVACTYVIYSEDSNMIRYTIAAYYAVGSFAQIGLLFNTALVKPIYRLHDLVIGQIMFFFLFALAALHFPSHVQTWLLYHNALSADVVIEDILKYSRKSQEKSGGTDVEIETQVAELKKEIKKQEEMIRLFMSGNANMGMNANFNANVNSNSSNGSLRRNVSTDAINRMVAVGGGGEGGGDGSGSSEHQHQNQSPQMPNRQKVAVSMADLSSWGGGEDGMDGGTASGGAGASSSAASASASASASNSPLAGTFQFSQPDVMPPR